MNADEGTVAVVVPDGIEPVEAWRCWTFEHGELRSLAYGGLSAPWKPGEPFVATCHATDGKSCRWIFAPRGMGRAEAESTVDEINRRAQAMSGFGRSSVSRPLWCPPLPTAEPPPHLGYHLEIVEHTAPDAGCTCGVYAVANEDGIPPGGTVWGKVKLWGTVIPGERGFRAQFAYPSELHVQAELRDAPELLAFGVPLIVHDGDCTYAAASSPGQAWANNVTMTPAQYQQALARIAARERPSVWQSMPAVLRIAVAANVGAALLNLGLLIGRAF